MANCTQGCTCCQEVVALREENKRIRDAHYEAACLRTGHVATAAKLKIAALEKVEAAARAVEEYQRWYGVEVLPQEAVRLHTLRDALEALNQAPKPNQRCGDAMPIMGFRCTEPAGHEGRHRCSGGSWPNAKEW